MKIENFFLRYAYPCAFIIMQRGEITSEKLQKLEETAVYNKDISKTELEKVFHNAFHFIDQLAKLKGKERWDAEIIKEYFHSYHNKVIDNREGIYKNAPPILRELSKVYIADIIKKEKDAFLIEYNDNNKRKKRSVLNRFTPEAKVGDKVRIHYGYAVELVK